MLLCCPHARGHKAMRARRLRAWTAGQQAWRLRAGWLHVQQQMRQAMPHLRRCCCSCTWRSLQARPFLLARRH